MTPIIAIRPAFADEAATLRRLALLDSAEPLRGDALLATVDGRAVAALGLDDGRVVADPFVRTREVVSLLRMRAAHLRPSETRGRRRAPLRARLGFA